MARLMLKESNQDLQQLCADYNLASGEERKWKKTKEEVKFAITLALDSLGVEYASIPGYQIKAASQTKEKKQSIAELNIRYNEANRNFKYDKELKDKKYNVTIGGKRKELSGEQIVKEIDTNIEKTMNNMYEFISGQPGALDNYINQDQEDQIKKKR